MPEAVNIMAEVAAGGDRKKLEKMMKAGQLDPIKILPLFFEALGKRAGPFLDDFFKSIEYRRGKAQKNTEDWLKAFMAGGGNEGIAGFFRTFGQIMGDSVSSAAKIGALFKEASKYLRVAMLAPGEVLDWLQGNDKSGNFMTALFGKGSESDFVESIKTTFGQVQVAIVSAMDASTQSVSKLKNEFSLLNDFLAPLIKDIGSMFELSAAYNRGGVSGLVEANMKIEGRSRAKEQAKQEADDLYSRTGVRTPLSEINARADSLFFESERARKAGTDGGGGFWQKMQSGVVSSGSKLDESGLNPDNWGKWAGNGLRNWLDGLVTQAPTSPMSYTKTPLGWSSPAMPNTSSMFPANNPSAGFNNTGVSPNGAKIELNLTGSIDVKGAITDDVTTSDNIKRGIQNMIAQSLGLTKQMSLTPIGPS